MEQIFAEAKWIGHRKRNLYAHAMSVFRFSCELMLAQGSWRAGVLFGGNDCRLMDRNKNLQGVETKRDESFVILQLDIRPMEEGKPGILSAWRFGYAPEDGISPLHQTEIPLELLHSGNAHEFHKLSGACVYGQVELYFDGALLTRNSDPFAGNVWNLNPVGAGNNYICFPLLCDVGIWVPREQTARYRRLEIRNYREPCSLLYTEFPRGKGFYGGEQGLIQLWDPSRGSMTELKTDFSLRGAVASAKLTATARGVYTLYLNGKRVGEDYLAPGLSQYNKTHYYQTYDVTELLQPGENQWKAELGEGWWSGAITFSGEKWNFFGDRQSLIGALDITYADGTEQRIVTDPDLWEASQDGPIVYSSLFQGEVYDFRREGKETWEAAVEIPLSRENAFIGGMVLPPFGQKVQLDYEDFHLQPQPDRGVRVVARLTARSMSTPRPGVYVYDMGQNIAGIPKIRITGREGQKITLRYAEILYPDLPEYKDQAGMLMLENIRGALATDVAILRDGEQEICPHFTFHGYQYIEITGLEEPLPLEAVQGLALSSVDITAEFSCSDPEITRLFQNICWSLRDNCISIPTDCPQRNERMGWSGDLSVFSETMVLMADCKDFLRRHLQALRDTQSPEGRFDDVAPVGGGFGGILWGSAGITVPWAMYRQFQDEEILAEHFPAMCRYGRYLSSKVDRWGLVDEGPLGDWLSPENGKTEPRLLWQSYYIYDLDIIIQCADILKDTQTEMEFMPLYKQAKRKLYSAFLDSGTKKTLYSTVAAAKGEGGGPPSPEAQRPMPEQTDSGRYIMDTQASYAVPLALEVLRPQDLPKIKKHLRDAVCRENTDDTGTVRPPYSLMTGFIGTAWILPALSLGNMDREAWRMLRNRAYPSWLYPVTQGATTIWERLDSYTTERGFGGNNSMNSFNHYSFGAVGKWILSRALGIKRAENGNVSMKPIPDPDAVVTWAEGSIVVEGARYFLRWEIGEKYTTYHVKIPKGREAILYLPARGGSYQPVPLNAGAHRFTVPHRL